MHSHKGFPCPWRRLGKHSVLPSVALAREPWAAASHQCSWQQRPGHSSRHLGCSGHHGLNSYMSVERLFQVVFYSTVIQQYTVQFINECLTLFPIFI